jgi:hypothetical protein
MQFLVVSGRYPVPPGNFPLVQHVLVSNCQMLFPHHLSLFVLIQQQIFRIRLKRHSLMSAFTMQPAQA